jgi:hypothetical protein
LAIRPFSQGPATMFSSSDANVLSAAGFDSTLATFDDEQGRQR